VRLTRSGERSVCYETFLSVNKLGCIRGTYPDYMKLSIVQVLPLVQQVCVEVPGPRPPALVGPPGSLLAGLSVAATQAIKHRTSLR
jgi:hypothetical protein